MGQYYILVYYRIPIQVAILAGVKTSFNNAICKLLGKRYKSQFYDKRPGCEGLMFDYPNREAARLAANLVKQVAGLDAVVHKVMDDPFD